MIRPLACLFAGALALGAAAASAAVRIGIDPGALGAPTAARLEPKSALLTVLSAASLRGPGITAALEDSGRPVVVRCAVARLEALAPAEDDLRDLLRTRIRIAAVLIDLDGLDAPVPEQEGIVRRLASLVRGARNGVEVLVDLTGPTRTRATLARNLGGHPELAPYYDGALLAPPETANLGEEKTQWEALPGAGDLMRTLAFRAPARNGVETYIVHPRSSDALAADLPVLERLASAFSGLVPGATGVQGQWNRNGVSESLEPYSDPASGDRLLVLPGAPGARAQIAAAGQSTVAVVENLETGERRRESLTPGRPLSVDLGEGSFTLLLPGVRPNAGLETSESVTVQGRRPELSVDEIVARERAWDSGQRQKVDDYTARMTASLRFQVQEVNETFDLTIEGPLLARRGEPVDWAWETFYVNGVKWKGRSLPKLPILQPEKVAALPLEITLDEKYDYRLAGEQSIDGIPCYMVDFTPKESAALEPLYKGRAWIDKETFALRRRRETQVNLKGETLSNVRTEFFEPVGQGLGLLFPTRIRGETVFSTAGRTTAVEQDVRLTSIEVNRPDFLTRRHAIYASPDQMIRDTDRGLRYLESDGHGGRKVQWYVSKKSLFGLVGVFSDRSLSYPIPILGLQYFDLDFKRTGKQISVFWGGALLSADYSDPALFGSRFDLDVSLFGDAIAFKDTSYRNSREVRNEALRHRPEQLEVTLGRPLGSFLKASVGVFSKYDGYGRDDDTRKDFVVPADTTTEGVEGKLQANWMGYRGSIDWQTFRRDRWRFWGVPGESEYAPSQKTYQKFELSLSKDQYFSGFRKLHVGLSYLTGSNLDRFSRYEFGYFSGNYVHGYRSGSLRTTTALVANVSYGLNIEDIIRLEGFYDSIWATDQRSGFARTYFSGAGAIASLQGPWENSLIRVDFGIPVVRHHESGFVVQALLLKLF